MAIRKGGMLVYNIYRVLSYGLSSLVYLRIRWRKLRGLEHPLRWPERLGHPSLSRPPGPLVWFHAVSLGEGMAAIPVIKQCMQQRPDLNILMTTSTVSAFEVIEKQLPGQILYQFAPVDTPAVMKAFLGYWKPSVIVLMESELWPNLIMCASETGIELVLINARMSFKSFERWSRPLLLPLISRLLSRFSLIAPLSNMQGIQFQLLEAPPHIINFSGDLKYVMLAVHKYLLQKHNDTFTIVVPRYPQHGREIFQLLKKESCSVALRSQHKRLEPGTNLYIVDTLGELRQLFRLTPIAVIGGSFRPGLAGHNLSEAAAVGCAVLTGLHVGHFSNMVMQMQKINSMSVLQVSGNHELAEALDKLFTDTQLLEAHQLAAKEAFCGLSSEKNLITRNCQETELLMPVLFISLVEELAENGEVQIIRPYHVPPASFANQNCHVTGRDISGLFLVLLKLEKAFFSHWQVICIEGDDLYIISALQGSSNFID